MLTLKVYKDEDKLREISVEDNNFLLVQNGNYGPVYDTDNFAFLRIDQTLPWFYKPLDYLKSLA